MFQKAKLNIEDLFSHGQPAGRLSLGVGVGAEHGSVHLKQHGNLNGVRTLFMGWRVGE